jgi:hypothetical protein
VSSRFLENLCTPFMWYLRLLLWWILIYLRISWYTLVALYYCFGGPWCFYFGFIFILYMEAAFYSEYWHLLNRQHNFTSQMTVIVSWALAWWRMSELHCFYMCVSEMVWGMFCFLFNLWGWVSLHCLYLGLLILSSNKNSSCLFVLVFYYIST